MLNQILDHSFKCQINYKYQAIPSNAKLITNTVSGHSFLCHWTDHYIIQPKEGTYNKFLCTSKNILITTLEEINEIREDDHPPQV